MRNHSATIRFMLASACGLALAGLLSAQGRQQPNADAHQSKEPGRAMDSIPVLRRQTTDTPEAKLSSLLAAISKKPSGEIAKEKRRDRIRATGDTWWLDVFGDGSGAEFLDRAVAGRAHQNGVDASKAMSAGALESAARAYIERTLSRVIILQPGERLVAVATSFRTEGGVARDGSSPYSAVVANRIVFSREIGGIPVVGAGSKVTITFLNDGSLESFRYDWPSYTRTGRVQHLAQPSNILRRLQRVAGVRTGGDVSGAIAMPLNIELVKSMRLGDKVQLQDLKCGYYDPGFMNRDVRAPVQAGCYYHVVHTGGDSQHITTAAYSGAVPAAQVPESDSRWPEAAVLRGVRMKGRPPARSAGPGTKIQPVPPRPKGPRQVPEKED